MSNPVVHSREPFAAALVSAGCDYITATCEKRKSFKMFTTAAEELIHDDARREGEIRPWRALGYLGFTTGQVSIGARDDGAIIRLSGQAAKHNWRKAYEHSTNVSRFDAQRTHRLEIPPVAYIKASWARARRAHEKGQVRPTLEMRNVTGNSSTFYVGKRISDQYGRIYDKANESKDERWRMCLRSEVESKGAAAVQRARLFAKSGDDERTADGFVYQWFTERHVGTPRSINSDRTRLDPIPPGGLNRTQAWLANSVRPSVERLIAAGRLNEVLIALGLSEIVVPIAAGREK